MVKDTPKQKITITTVRWLDASYQHGETSLDDFEPEVELVSVGQLVKETRRVISLALNSWQEHDTYRHIEHIPKKMIVRRVDRTVWA